MINIVFFLCYQTVKNLLHRLFQRLSMKTVGICLNVLFFLLFSFSGISLAFLGGPPSGGTPLPEKTWFVSKWKEGPDTIREYSINGTVFAVSYRGIRIPDLKILIGPYYEEYRSLSFRKLRGESIKTGDIGVLLGGHMRDLHGMIWIRKSVPKGFLDGH